MKEKKQRNIALPGLIIENQVQMKSDNTSKIGDQLIFNKTGLIDVFNDQTNILPYKNIYKPKQGDFVIGIVIGFMPNGWQIDLFSYKKHMLPAAETPMLNTQSNDKNSYRRRPERFDPTKHELKDFLKIGDIIRAEVIDAGRLGNSLLSMNQRGSLEKISNAYYIKINVSKLPRIIGKKGSMLKLLEDTSNTKLFVGQNGVIAIEGTIESYKKVKETINMISRNIFMKGLNDKVLEMLK